MEREVFAQGGLFVHSERSPSIEMRHAIHGIQMDFLRKNPAQFLRPRAC